MLLHFVRSSTSHCTFTFISSLLASICVTLQKMLVFDHQNIYSTADKYVGVPVRVALFAYFHCVLSGELYRIELAYFDHTEGIRFDWHSNLTTTRHVSILKPTMYTHGYSKRFTYSGLKTVVPQSGLLVPVTLLPFVCQNNTLATLLMTLQYKQ